MLADVKAEPYPTTLPASSAGLSESAAAREKPWLLASITLALAGLVMLSGLAIARHQAYASGRQDLEIYVQTLWNTAQGRPFATTLLKSNELHLAEHLALILLPLTPFYGLLPDPRALLIVQQLGLVVAAGPIWLAGRRLLGTPPAFFLLAAFLLSPALGGIALDDFHPVALTAAPLAAAAWLLYRQRWRSGLALALASLLLEEEAALVVAGLGLWLLLTRRWRPGLGLLAAGGGLLLAAALLIMPGYHHPATLGAAGGNRALNHFAELRGNPGGAAARLVGDRGADAALSLLLPTGGLALLAPGLLTALLPTSATLLLQDRLDTFHRHWIAPVLPLVWLAAAVGLRRLTAGRPRNLGLAVLGVGALSAYLFASPLPGGRAFQADSLLRGPRQADLDQAIAAVPPRAPLAASANVAAHLANRQWLYVFPIDDHYLSGLGFETQAVEGYVLDLQEADTQRVAPLRRSSPLQSDPPYVVWSSGHKVMLLTRQQPDPSRKASETFNRRLALLGYDIERGPGRPRLTLYWQKLRDIFADFDRQAELVDASGAVVARDRGLPLTSIFTTEKWRVGQLVVDQLDLPIPLSGSFTVRLAWVNRDRGTPMPVDGGGPALDLRVEP